VLLTQGGRILANFFPVLFCASVLFLVIAQNVQAQSLSDPNSPGVQEQQRQRQFLDEQRRRLMPPPQAPPTPAPPLLEEDVWLPEGETPCFTIQKITLEGDASRKFQFALKAAGKVFATGQPDSPIGKCLGTRGVNLVLKRIQNEIIRQGYITTKVLASPQGLKDGVLKLLVVPGRIHAIRFTEDSHPRIVTWNTMSAQPGDILNLREIEQGLENLKRPPTADADFQIVPAGADAKPGESDVVIRYAQKFPMRLDVSLENSGGKATGRYLNTISGSYDNLLGLSDLFYVSGTYTPVDGDPSPGRTHSFAVGYSVPFRRFLLSFHADYYEYLQTQRSEEQSIKYSGTAESFELRLSYMLYRDANRKLEIFGAVGTKEIHNFLDDTEIMVQRRRTSTLTVGANHREYFSNKGYLDITAQVAQGEKWFGAIPAPEEASGEGVSRPTIYSGTVELEYPFKLGALPLHYHGKLNGQYSDQPLAATDRFSIGGRYTVRGFTGDSTLLAEKGFVWRNELGVPLWQSGQELYVACDYGAVDGPSVHTQLGHTLSGAALGLRGGYKYFAYDVFVGIPWGMPKKFDADSVVGGFRVSASF